MKYQNNKLENPIVLLLWGQKAVKVLKDMDPDMEKKKDIRLNKDFKILKVLTKRFYNTLEILIKMKQNGRKK